MKKPLTFRCACGGGAFIDFIKEEDELWISFYEEPDTLFNWLKALFRKRRYAHEIILDKEDTKEFIKFIKKEL